jgi:inner membrane protein
VPALIGGTATDLRWSPPGTGNFSTLDVTAAAGTPCPHPVPGWGVPRADLLGGPQRAAGAGATPAVP